MHIQLLHTSASLAINENWDPDVRDDMEMMLNRIVPEDVPFRHSCEGPDDMVRHMWLTYMTAWSVKATFHQYFDILELCHATKKLCYYYSYIFIIAVGNKKGTAFVFNSSFILDDEVISCIDFSSFYSKFSNIRLSKSPFFFSIFQPAHVKACFLGSNLTVPVSDGKLNLGTWQGVWLCEHRDRAGSRKVLVTVNGALKDAQRTPMSQPASPIASNSS